MSVLDLVPLSEDRDIWLRDASMESEFEREMDLVGGEREGERVVLGDGSWSC